MDLRWFSLSLLPWTRSLAHAVFLQTSASITWLWWPRRLGANAACLCCGTRGAGRAPSGAATRLWSIHLNWTLKTFVLAFTAESWPLLGAYRCRTMCTPREVKTALISGVFEAGGNFGGIFLRIFRNPARFRAYPLGYGQGCILRTLQATFTEVNRPT
jgi:hypothetical protein